MPMLGVFIRPAEGIHGVCATWVVAMRFVPTTRSAHCPGLLYRTALDHFRQTSGLKWTFHGGIPRWSCEEFRQICEYSRPLFAHLEIFIQIQRSRRYATSVIIHPWGWLLFFLG
ncbi:hypothetical protein B0O80DRAFT_171184 [Mortierella sp. GBAus27b]|nr:hypothetical protein B0O80DRAFT_171184 [Mortierella sp. GBAus27b]